MFDQPETNLYKLLAHPERLAVLRRLMAAEATLTQLGAHFMRSPAHIRHHLKLLEEAGLVVFSGERTVQGGPEKYYRATRQALLIHTAILPEALSGGSTVAVGSIDLGIAALAAEFSTGNSPVRLQRLPLSSLDSLIALRQGLCQAATCHLLDETTGEYNRVFVQHLFPGQTMLLMQLYRREIGLLVRAGNPAGINNLADVAEARIRFVNRECGSGIRQWLDIQLRKLAILPKDIQGYQQIAHSHAELASAIASGQADAGVGIAGVAQEYDLEFIPLHEEPFDLVTAVPAEDDQRIEAMFEFVNSGRLRGVIEKIPGYHLSEMTGRLETIH